MLKYSENDTHYIVTQITMSFSKDTTMIVKYDKELTTVQVDNDPVRPLEQHKKDYFLKYYMPKIVEARTKVAQPDWQKSKYNLNARKFWLQAVEYAAGKVVGSCPSLRPARKECIRDKYNELMRGK